MGAFLTAPSEMSALLDPFEHEAKEQSESGPAQDDGWIEREVAVLLHPIDPAPTLNDLDVLPFEKCLMRNVVDQVFELFIVRIFVMSVFLQLREHFFHAELLAQLIPPCLRRKLFVWRSSRISGCWLLGGVVLRLFMPDAIVAIGKDHGKKHRDPKRLRDRDAEDLRHLLPVAQTQFREGRSAIDDLALEIETGRQKRQKK